MELEFTITPEDYIGAVRLNQRRRMMMRAVSFTVATVGLACAVKMRNRPGGNELDGLFFAVLFVGAIVLADYLWIIPHKVRKLHRQQKTLQEPMRYTLTQTAVMIETGHGRAEFPWKTYHKWKEGRVAFLMFHSDVAYNILPKHAFRTADEIAWLRDVLTEQLGKPAG